MTSEQAPNALYLLLLLLLVGSSLFAMRIAPGKALKMGLAWVAIFAAGFALFAFRDDFGALGAKLRSEATGAQVESRNGEMLVRQREDGHFWVNARVNGVDVRFLVDSGATTTTISQKVAASANIETGMRADIVSTANGTVAMPRGKAGLIEVGPIRRTDMAVNVSPSDDLNVLGMNFLSTLTSWGVRGDTLVLRA